MRKGVRVAIKSDSEDFTRRLNQEAAKTIRYGGATEEEALKMITLNPAWIIGVDDRVGSIDVGKDADLVIWDGYPLSSFGVPNKVMIDGDIYFDRSLPGFGMPHYKEGDDETVVGRPSSVVRNQSFVVGRWSLANRSRLTAIFLAGYQLRAAETLLCSRAASCLPSPMV